MKGKIMMINHHKGMIAVLTEHNDYSIMDVLEHNIPEKGNYISGDLEMMGGGNLANETKEYEFDVFIQEIHTINKQAIQMLDMHNENRREWEMI